jgi:hypothetical protein
MLLCLGFINHSAVHSKILLEASSVSTRSVIDHQQNRVCFSIPWSWNSERGENNVWIGGRQVVDLAPGYVTLQVLYCGFGSSLSAAAYDA